MFGSPVTEVTFKFRRSRKVNRGPDVFRCDFTPSSTFPSCSYQICIRIDHFRNSFYPETQTKGRQFAVMTITEACDPDHLSDRWELLAISCEFSWKRSIASSLSVVIPVTARRETV